MAGVAGSMKAINILTEPIITVASASGARDRVTLPALFAALVEGRIVDFPLLRPHQEQAWHCFLVQLGVLATEDAHTIPDDEEGWRQALRALTSDWPGDEPWHLVSPHDKPAFLQAPVIGSDPRAWKSGYDTPDEMDILVTSRCHDLKGLRMSTPSFEDWLFALLVMQTTDGFMGRGNYGVMRMNGGYGSRPFLGVAPADGTWSARVLRDLRVLRRCRDRVFKDAPGFATRRAVKLVWLEPWNGATALTPADVHPLAIEICRRARLISAGRNALRVATAASSCSRIEAENLRGVTGDPWTPIVVAKDGAKSLSVSGVGFGWSMMCKLLFGGDKNVSYVLPLLAKPQREDAGPIELVAAAVERGQGKTEAFHSRTILVSSPAAIRALADEGEEHKRLVQMAKRMTELVMAASGKCLRPALFLLFQKGPEQAKLDHATTSKQVEPWLTRFDHLVDQAFFPRLWEAVEGDGSDQDALFGWTGWLNDTAREVLEQAIEAAPATDQRRFLAAQRARDMLRNALRKHVPVPSPEARTTTEAVNV